MANGKWQNDRYILSFVICHLPSFPSDWVADGSANIVLQSERVRVVHWTIDPVPSSMLFTLCNVAFILRLICLSRGILSKRNLPILYV